MGSVTTWYARDSQFKPSCGHWNWFFTLFKACIETIKNSKHHLPKMKRSQYIANLSKSYKDVELVFSLHKRRESKLGMFSTSYTNIWPIFRMIICRILKKQWKLWLLMCINVYDAATNLEVCGFIKNTKI